MEYFKFRSGPLAAIADRLAAEYQAAQPFPHAFVDDFLPLDVARRLAAVFPERTDPIFVEKDKIHQPRKLGIRDPDALETIDPYLHNMLWAFQSGPFVKFVERLTGIPKLLPDPHLRGSIQMTLSGGFLSVHTDFNWLPSIELYRRVNAILYLTEDWRPEYNGELELWNGDGTHRVKSLAPTFNRLLVFNTDKSSFHGHPIPLNVPDHIARRSIAFFYYTSSALEGERYDNTTEWIERRV